MTIPLPSAASGPTVAGPAAADPARLWRRGAIAAAATALLALGALAGAAWQRTAAPAPASVVADAAAPSTAAQRGNGSATAGEAAHATHAAAPAQTGADASRPGTRHAARRATPQVEGTRSATAGERTTPLATERTAAALPDERPAAPVCADCGVVESVTAVTEKGQGSGLGAVAGGVLGGVVGHQVGGGRGRDAMTVLGAIGGGLAGHEIEKRQRSTTHYVVRVRMDDGSQRTLRQSQAPAVGQPVRVDGDRLLPAGTPARPPATGRSRTPADNEGGTLQTAQRV